MHCSSSKWTYRSEQHNGQNNKSTATSQQNNASNERSIRYIHEPSASHKVTPQELAEAGFYNTHRDDRVQCAFCLGVLHNWKKGDTAMGEHRRHFPGCVLVKAIDHIEDAKCKVCMKARVKVVFFPCLHLVCCEHCSYLMTSCAVCQTGIQSRLKVFLVSTCPNRIEQAG